MAKTSKTKLLSPLYTGEGKSLGGSPVGGPTGSKPTPDPLKFAPFDLRGGRKGDSKGV